MKSQVSKKINQTINTQKVKTRIFFAAGSNCQYDSVSIFEGAVNGTSKGRFCGLTAPQPIATRGSMVVRFKTDRDTSDDGWKATYVRSGEMLFQTCPQYILAFRSDGSCGTIKKIKMDRITFWKDNYHPFLSVRICLLLFINSQFMF